MVPYSLFILYTILMTIFDQKLSVAVQFFRYSGPCPAFPVVSLPLLKEPQLRHNMPFPLVVDLKDRVCGSSALVGGKGSALALMTSLEENKVRINSCYLVIIH
jgi:hypothetical protein